MEEKRGKDVSLFVQARMSSSRFPGKMLAPFRGLPLIDHVMDAVRASVEDSCSCVLLTSTDPTDDPLANHAQSRGWTFFRGDLQNVFARFQDALECYPANWIARVCGDSPLIQSSLIQMALSTARQGNYDVVTNVHPRTFPKGQSIEVLRSSVFRSINPAALSEVEQEHVTPYFYNNRSAYTVHNLVCPRSFPIVSDCVIDSLDDLRRLETVPL